MFTLWYSVLSWREYRDVILEKLSPKKPSNSTPVKDTAIVSPLPPRKPEPSRIPVIEPPKQPPSPIPPKSPSPQPPISPPPPINKPASPLPPSPQPPSSPLPQRPLEPPAKPPRSPSPHPMRTEAFEDDIEYEEEDSEAEEDDENSIVGSPQSPQRRTVTNSVNDFLNQEINSTGQNNVGLNPR